MPELPEVEMVVRGLRNSLTGRAITGATVYWAREIATPSVDVFAAKIQGQRILELRRRGKFIVADLTRDVLLVHLKMTGRLYIADPGEERPDDRWLRVSFGLDNGRELRFSDSRKFGRVYLVPQIEDITSALGPEPLDNAFTAEVFQSRLSQRRGMVKTLLLNQRFIAGVGNIYADEALWLAKIDPRRKVDTLEPIETYQLYSALRQVLHQGIRHEGASIRWYRKPDGTQGESQEHFEAYEREGQPCHRCGTPIQKIWLGQRGTHFCPACQV